MTATPIPRSLAMTVYGDLDAAIDELPKGPAIVACDLPIEASTGDRLLKEHLQKGRQAYVIFPWWKSEKIDLKSAITEYEN